MALPLLSQLVAHYKMNDNSATTTVIESTGNYNGVMQHGNTNTHSVAGKINQALDFDGANDWVKCDYGNAFSFNNNAGTDYPFSISVWVKFDVLSGTQLFISKSFSSSSSWEYDFFLYNGNRLHFQMINGPGYSARIGRYYNTPISDTTNWHHYVMTYSGNKLCSGVKLYIDAIRVDDLDFKLASYTGMSQTGNPLAIGRENSESPTNGQIDDVRIYNIELTQDNINSIYENGNGTEDEDPYAGVGGFIY